MLQIFLYIELLAIQLSFPNIIFERYIVSSRITQEVSQVASHDFDIVRIYGTKSDLLHPVRSMQCEVYIKKNLGIKIFKYA